MKEFTIEDYDINSDDLSVSISYFFYGTLKDITFTKEQIEEVFEVNNLYEWLVEEFSQHECILLLKHYIREYSKNRKKNEKQL